MGWFKKDDTAKGVVMFRGAMAPRPDEFEFLANQGIRIKKQQNPPDKLLWAAGMRHPDWGDAILFCPRQLAPPPPEWITIDARLSDAEKETALLGRSALCLHVEPKHGNVLRDRKSLLRYMRAVLGDDGVVAFDHASLRMWSKDALDAELCHDADLDIEALYTLHVVGDDAGERPIWLHTHGLAAIGHFDFDILEPSEDLFGGASDAIRAIAFAIAEGTVKPSTDVWQLAEPGGAVRFVEAAEFQRKADRTYAAMRDDPSGDHVERRAVLCEPVGKIGKLFGGGGKPAPSKFLSRPFPEEGIVSFSDAATKLSADRARKTYGMFRRLAGELADFGFPNIAKLGYAIDGATGEDEKEHLWFEVHAMHDDQLDATLQSSPFHIAAMKAGHRGMHDAERLSDWSILTPAGIINPRNTAPARMIRENREALLKMMKEAQPSSS